MKFLSEAPNHDHLHHKMILALGVSGRLHREEIYNIEMKDIQQEDDSCVVVTIPDTKGNVG